MKSNTRATMDNIHIDNVHIVAVVWQIETFENSDTPFEFIMCIRYFRGIHHYFKAQWSQFCGHYEMLISKNCLLVRFQLSAVKPKRKLSP